MRACHACGAEQDPYSAIGHTSSCPQCRADLKCCLNCISHEPGSRNDCREPHAEPVSDVAKANFCDFFQFRSSPGPGSGGSGGDAASARNAFDALFKKK